MTGSRETTWRARSPARGTAVPADIAPLVRAIQVDRALAHVPMLYAVGIFNILLVAILCAYQGLSPLSYGWMGVVALAAVFRMVKWMRRSRAPRAIEDPERMLRNMTCVAIGAIGGLSAWTVYAQLTGLIENLPVVPISLAFGATCIAHCLAPIKKAAVGSLLVGVVPPALVMTFTGPFQTSILGASMLTISFLMTVFIVESYNRIIAGIVMKEEIRRLAHSDALTGLANRRAMMELLEAADAGDAPYALAMIDLDSFKAVNDGLGHHVGDELLKVVGARLRAAALPSEHVARMGGDEFLILMPGVAEAARAERRVEAFGAVLCRPAAIGDRRVPLSGSIGCALRYRDGPVSEELLVAADAALYAQKGRRPSLVAVPVRSAA